MADDNRYYKSTPSGDAELERIYNDKHNSPTITRGTGNNAGSAVIGPVTMKGVQRMQEMGMLSEQQVELIKKRMLPNLQSDGEMPIEGRLVFTIEKYDPKVGVNPSNISQVIQANFYRNDRGTELSPSSTMSLQSKNPLPEKMSRDDYNALEPANPNGIVGRIGMNEVDMSGAGANALIELSVRKSGGKAAEALPTAVQTQPESKEETKNPKAKGFFQGLLDNFMNNPSGMLTDEMAQKRMDGLLEQEKTRKKDLEDKKARLVEEYRKNGYGPDGHWLGDKTEDPKTKAFFDKITSPDTNGKTTSVDLSKLRSGDAATQGPTGMPDALKVPQVAGGAVPPKNSQLS